jgi:Fe2+ transport system protein FeoA
MDDRPAETNRESPGHPYRQGHQHRHGWGERVVQLRDLQPGSCGTISRLSCNGKLRRRLMDMGVVAGAPIEVERVAPLGDPVELKIKDFHLSLRKEEAGDIWVEVENQDRGRLVPLSFMRPGEGGVLVEIRGLKHRVGEVGRALGAQKGRFFHPGHGHRLEQRLNSLGLVPGTELKVVQSNAPGPIIVAVKDSRLCLGRAIAGKLMVKPEEEGPRSRPAD